MVFSEGDILYMVTESVKKILSEGIILEYHGALDEKLEGLAKLILSNLKNCKNGFVLHKENIAPNYPYDNCPNVLNIQIQKLDKHKFAAYSPTNKTIKITPSFIFFDDDYIIEALMHELTHWVNDVESLGAISKGRISVMTNNDKEKLLKEILYLFDSSEIQARTTQVKWRIEKEGYSNDNDLERVTHLKRMLFLINEIENEDYFEYKTSYGYDDAFGTLVEGLLSQRAYYKYTIDGKERWSNFLSENEFTKAKSSILKKLKTKYNKFKTNIDKIIYDFKSKSNSST